MEQPQFCQASKCIQSFTHNKLFSVTQALQSMKQEQNINWRKKPDQNANYMHTSQNYNTPSDATWKKVFIMKGRGTEKLVRKTLQHFIMQHKLDIVVYNHSLGSKAHQLYLF